MKSTQMALVLCTSIRFRSYKRSNCLILRLQVIQICGKLSLTLEDNSHMLQHQPDQTSRLLMLRWLKSNLVCHLKDLLLSSSTLSHIQHDPGGIKYLNLQGGFSEQSICGYADAAFANNADLAPQLEMVIAVCCKNNKACVVQYASWKCKRMTKALFAAELYAVSACFYYCFTLACDMMLAAGHRIPVLLFMDLNLYSRLLQACLSLPRSDFSLKYLYFVTLSIVKNSKILVLFRLITT